MTVHHPILPVLALAEAASAVIGTSLEIAVSRLDDCGHSPAPAGRRDRGVPK